MDLGVLHKIVPYGRESKTMDVALLGNTTDDLISRIIFERWR